MIIDSSVMMAIVLAEPEASVFLQAMQQAESLRIAAPTVVELKISAERRRGQDAVALIDELLADLLVEVVPCDKALAEEAVLAWPRFGKGNHEAALNFGDTFSYALAKLTREPLLFKGQDFSATDIPNALEH